MNDALVKQVASLELQYWRNAQNSPRQCVQIMSMPNSIAHSDLLKKLCKVSYYNGADTYEEKIESCHRLNKKSLHTIVTFLGGKTVNK